MAHHLKTRPDPNVGDPLSEPTVGRRIWATYLALGFNRRTWAEKTGITYQTADNYDTGRTAPSLEHVMLAAQLSGFTTDQLCWGYNRPHGLRDEQELSREAVKSLLHDLRASDETKEALAMHEQSAAGHYQRFTRSYVGAFCERFSLARREGLGVQAAIDAAKATAANARANAEAVAAKLSAPVSAETLSKLGARIKNPEKTSVENASAKRRKRA